MKMNHPDLAQLPEVFKLFPEICAVYLFGSVASGKTHQHSDLDLAIVSDRPQLSQKKLDILSNLAGRGFCDVHLIFLNEADIVTQYEAVFRNKVIYQTPEFNRGEIYSNVIHKYLDFYPYLEVQRKAIKKRLLKNGSS